MDRENEVKLNSSVNAIDPDDFAAYQHELNSGIADTIDFSDDIEARGVIEFEKPKTPEKDENEEMPAEEEFEDSEEEDDEYETDESGQEEGRQDQGLFGNYKKLIIFAVCAGICTIAITALITRRTVEAEKATENLSLQAAPAQDDAEQAAPVPKTIEIPFVVSPDSARAVVDGVVPGSTVETAHAAGMLPILKNSSNTIAFFADGYVPVLINTTPDHDFTRHPVSPQLISGDNYQMSVLTIHAPQNVNLTDTILYINGRPGIAKARQDIKVVSGMPVIIHVREKGHADHLHLVWPTREAEILRLPDLRSTDESKNTEFEINVPHEYLADKSFEMKISAGGETSTAPGRRTVAKDAVIDIMLAKNDRSPLNLHLAAAPFGSVAVDAYMLIKTDGTASVKIDSKSPDDITMCFRRPGTVFCIDDKSEKNEIPAGKWEAVAYKTDPSGKKTWFSASSYETLDKDGSYVFRLKERNGNFDYKKTKVRKRKGHRRR